MCAGGTRLPVLYGCGKTGAGRGGGRGGERGVRQWLEEQGAGAEEPDARGELPLFLPTPDFMALAEAG